MCLAVGKVPILCEVSVLWIPNGQINAFKTLKLEITKVFVVVVVVLEVDICL